MKTTIHYCQSSGTTRRTVDTPGEETPELRDKHRLAVDKAECALRSALAAQQEKTLCDTYP